MSAEVAEVTVSPSDRFNVLTYYKQLRKYYEQLDYDRPKNPRAQAQKQIEIWSHEIVKQLLLQNDVEQIVSTLTPSYDLNEWCDGYYLDIPTQHHDEYRKLLEKKIENMVETRKAREETAASRAERTNQATTRSATRNTMFGGPAPVAIPSSPQMATTSSMLFSAPTSEERITTETEVGCVDKQDAKIPEWVWPSAAPASESETIAEKQAWVMMITDTILTFVAFFIRLRVHLLRTLNSDEDIFPPADISQVSTGPSR
ncbi:MAG: hypothetical protein V3V61_02865 [Gammaproteobacteria bacterium]